MDYTPDQIMAALMGEPVDVDTSIDLGRAINRLPRRKRVALTRVSLGYSAREVYGEEHCQERFRADVLALAKKIHE